MRLTHVPRTARWTIRLAVLALAAIVCFDAVSVSAQPAKVVGGLRIGDDAGTPIGVVPDAGPGEKVFRLESGLTEFSAWLDYEGTSLTPVSVRLMAPQGVILDQQQRDLEVKGAERFDFEFDPPLNDDEYVVNVYVGDQSYLADSLQLLVGEAQLIPADNERIAEVQIDPDAAPGSVEAGNTGSLEAGVPPSASVGADSPLGPSPLLLVLAGLGVLGLLGVVVWAGMSAMSAR